ncbi:MAG: hypothetical protein LBB38_00505 [Puniceicoccales bacterium]|jgi:ribonucleoside-diphosphate reductase alpha chain|nr:hypothetical protein [Puniceicoccales bacterium]
MNLVMRVRRRNGQAVPWKREKIEIALRKAFLATGKSDSAAPAIAAAVERSVIPTAPDATVDIETIQDAVQNELLIRGEESTAMAYAAYRKRRDEERKTAQKTGGQQAMRFVHLRNGELRCWGDGQWLEWIRGPLMESGVAAGEEELLAIMLRGVPDQLNFDELRDIVLSNVLRRSKEDPCFAKLGTALGRRFLWDEVIGDAEDGRPMELRFGDHISKAVADGLLDVRFGEFDCVSLARHMDYARDKLLDWNAFDLLCRKFLLRDCAGPLELIQWFWMRIAIGLNLHSPRQNAEKEILELYGALSRLEFCPAETVLLYASTARPYLLSNYVYALEDSMEDIMVRGIAENALASRWGAGLGGSWSLIRGRGAPIGGSRKVSSGVVPFLDLHRQQLAIAGGETCGGCAYLDLWHADVEEFIALQKNFENAARASRSGLRTCLWIADLFMERLANGVEWWTFFQPNEMPELATLSGEEFSARYVQCEAMAERCEVWSKRANVRELWQKILASAFEIGFPCLAFGDNFQKTVRKNLPAIKAASLFGDCAMAMEREETACCACGTISLPAHLEADGTFSWERFQQSVAIAVRTLDNVISLTHFPSSGAERHCRRLRSLGLSVAGLHDLLRAQSIPYDSDGAKRISAEIFERLGYWAISASEQLAVERGPIAADNYSIERLPGDVEESDKVADLDWDGLRNQVRRNGLRNGYFIAGSAATAAAAILNVSPGANPLSTNVRILQLPSGERVCSLDPNLVTRLLDDGLWNPELAAGLCHLDGDLNAFQELPKELRDVFSTAFDCDPEKIIDLAAALQRRIDQSQQLPLYLRMPTFFLLSSMLQRAWRAGIKVIGPLLTTHAVSRERAMSVVNR